MWDDFRHMGRGQWELQVNLLGCTKVTQQIFWELPGVKKNLWHAAEDQRSVAIQDVSSVQRQQWCLQIRSNPRTSHLRNTHSSCMPKQFLRVPYFLVSHCWKTLLPVPLESMGLRVRVRSRRVVPMFGCTTDPAIPIIRAKRHQGHNKDHFM